MVSDLKQEIRELLDKWRTHPPTFKPPVIWYFIIYPQASQTTSSSSSMKQVHWAGTKKKKKTQLNLTSDSLNKKEPNPPLQGKTQHWWWCWESLVRSLQWQCPTKTVHRPKSEKNDSVVKKREKSFLEGGGHSVSVVVAAPTTATQRLAPRDLRVREHPDLRAAAAAEGRKSQW